MVSRRLVLVSPLLIAAGATSLPAQAQSEEVLGSRTVNLLADQDRIRVGLFEGFFRRIRLQVSGNAIFMEELTVTFLNGDVVTLPVRFLIGDGGQTRDINLPGVARVIRYIDMSYRRVPLGGRATVTVIGLR